MSAPSRVQRGCYGAFASILGVILFSSLLRAQDGATQPADPFASVGLGKSVTVFIVVSPNCPTCLEQMAFYKQLMSLPGMDGKDGKLIVLAQQGVIPVGKMLDEQGLKPHLLTSGPAETHEIRELPSLFILDARGKRIGTWPGKLTDEQKTKILTTIGAKANR